MASRIRILVWVVASELPTVSWWKDFTWDPQHLPQCYQVHRDGKQMSRWHFQCQYPAPERSPAQQRQTLPPQDIFLVLVSKPASSCQQLSLLYMSASGKAWTLARLQLLQRQVYALLVPGKLVASCSLHQWWSMCPCRADGIAVNWEDKHVSVS